MRNPEDWSWLAFPKPVTIKKTPKPLNRIGKRGLEKLERWEELIRKTPVKQIWERASKRIRENGTESALFQEIWEERPHICDMCGKTIPEPLSWCFPHILPKGKYPALRYNKRNIGLVCSIECHAEQDRRASWHDLEIITYVLWPTTISRLHFLCLPA